ncbi:MAG: phage tail tape measure protein [Rhizobiaceae bacterium]|nr:phage tail tape measure protein [Rhizobiaceae bacterium]
MEASLLIRLIDQFSAPAQTVREKMRGLTQGFREFRDGVKQSIRDGFSEANIEQATKNAEAKLNQARQRMRGAILTGLALAAPLKSIGDFEERLTAFGNTAGVFGDDLKKMEAQIRALGPDINQTATETLGALEYLVGKGLSPEQGMAALRAVGMTATAAGAEIEDTAASGFSVLDNLKVPADQLQLAFDAMAQAGKSGGFELKGMAQYFPQLTASARALGMDGVDAVAELAAALQIAMKGAGSESEAANNMQNFLSKLSSPETVKRFKDFGIDIKKEFATAEKNGVSVFEHMLKRINEATGGDQFKIGELFGDQQVLNFLKPMLQNMEEFNEIRNAALSAEGVNAADYARVMETLNAKLKGAVIEIGNLVSAGSPLLDIAKELVTQFTALLKAVNDFATANPELTRNIVYGVAALLAMNVAVRTLAWGFAAARVGAIGLSSFFLKFAADGTNIAAGWRLLSSAGWMLSGALAAVKFVAVGVGSILAGITAPAWALIAALIAAGFALWKYWDRISSFLAGFAAPFKELFSPVVQGAIDLVSGLIDTIGRLFGISPENIEGFKAAIGKMFDISTHIDAAKIALNELWDWISSFFSQEQLTGEEKAAMYASGQALAQQLIDGIKSIFDAFIGPFREAFNFAVSIEWPEPPAWVKWMMERAGAAADAAGGLIGAGRDQVSGWLGAGEGAEPPATTAGAATSAPSSGWLSNLFNWTGSASEDLQQGGQAVADGGQAAGAALNEAAAAVRGAASAMSSAAAGINTAVSRANRSGGSEGGYGQAMRNARAEALHDGTE